MSARLSGADRVKDERAEEKAAEPDPADVNVLSDLLLAVESISPTLAPVVRRRMLAEALLRSGVVKVIKEES